MKIKTNEIYSLQTLIFLFYLLISFTQFYFEYYTQRSIFLLRTSSRGPSSLLTACLPTVTHQHAVLAITLAALGSFLSKASSPKQSPLEYAFTSTAACPASRTFVAVASPDRRKKSSSPSSPSVIMYSPGWKFFSTNPSDSYDLS